jgi:hypothetical protein
MVWFKPLYLVPIEITTVFLPNIDGQNNRPNLPASPHS